jgi:hypothetical protein
MGWTHTTVRAAAFRVILKKLLNWRGGDWCDVGHRAGERSSECGAGHVVKKKALNT